MSVASNMAAYLRTDGARLGRHHRLVALALAALADEALDGPHGYTATPVAQVAPVVGLARSTTERTCRGLAVYGPAIVVCRFAGVQHAYTGDDAVRLPRGATVIGYRLLEGVLSGEAS